LFLDNKPALGIKALKAGFAKGGGFHLNIEKATNDAQGYIYISTLLHFSY
jgi:hypothetical protein